METLRIPSIPPAVGVRASASSPIIVATDGAVQSDAALAVGRLFAERPEAMRVVTVLPKVPVIPESVVVAGEEFVRTRRADTRRVIASQMARVWDQVADVEIKEGDPAAAVASLAHECGATMIVCGIGKHRVADRIFGSETALRLARQADVPIFAAAEGCLQAPQRIVVACDFSETSLRAARLAIEVAAPDATIFLAHVAPRDGRMFEDRDWIATYKQQSHDALLATRELLRIPAHMVVQPVVLQGDAATELMAFAESAHADLIATGSQGLGLVGRVLIGSVATRLLRLSTRSVLTVPPAAVMTPELVSVVKPGL